MTVPSGAGDPLLAATPCGWGRQTVAVGRAERRTGLRCLGAPAACRGRPRWAEPSPEGAAARERLAAAQAQPAPTWRTTRASTRLPAKAALPAWTAPGSREAAVPSPRTMAEGRHRLGFRLRKVGHATPHKKLAETAAIVAPREKKTRRPQPRPPSNACASRVTPRWPSGTSPAAASRGAMPGPVTTPWVCTSPLCPVGWWRKSVCRCASPWGVLASPALASSRPARPGGPREPRPRRGRGRSCRAQGIPVPHGGGGGRHVCSGWGRGARSWASLCPSCPPHPLRGKILPSRGVGVFGSCPGTGRSGWRSRRWWRGRSV